jgi:hypothetical protein
MKPAASVAKLGEISPFGPDFLLLGAFLSENYRPIHPKFTYISSIFYLPFVLSFPYFDHQFP